MIKTNKELTNLSDEELMILYQKGNYEAFDCIYKRHSGRLYGYFKAQIDENSAQELLQDFFVKIHKYKDRYDSSYPFLPWVFTVARNLLKDFYKKAERKIHKDELKESNLVDENKLEEGVKTLEDAMGLLSEKQQKVLLLRYLDNWSFEQIASDLETSPQNIRKIISRSLKKLKILMGVPNE